MNEDLRRLLRAAVSTCRRELEAALGSQLEGRFGIHRDGTVEAAGDLRALTRQEHADRTHLVAHLEHLRAAGLDQAASVEQLGREIAFTHLNRLVAFKMLERRKRIRETVGKSTRSRGFVYFQGERPEMERLVLEGKTDEAYRAFLLAQASQLAGEVGVLFSTEGPANFLFPPQKVLDAVLEQINDDALDPAWDETEALGWVYQYFTPREQREQARRQSAAPRNTYEMAFRNQFYTPRYVVDFLSQNTLGRLWDEMRGGATSLREKCRFLIYQPAPPPREKRDPRTLKVLDPACGSGHFLLACYNLLETIYEEAYADADLGPALQRVYPTLDAFRLAVPRLILEHNLHGIDIDRRAAQIAGLALWMRAQESYRRLGVSADEAPQIERTHVICAEPMPGEEAMLEEYLAGRPEVEQAVVRRVFQAMQLAGEAGSLLKIEDEMAGAIAEAKTMRLLDWQADFWEHPERALIESLEQYARERDFTAKLFLHDAAQGFGLIELCRQKYDVVLMNPPFGDASRGSKTYIDRTYPRTRNDVYAAFVERGLELLRPGGLLGAITSRTGFFLTTFRRWREEVLLEESSLVAVADLGNGVLDTAMVQTAAYCIEKTRNVGEAAFMRLLAYSDKERALTETIPALRDLTAHPHTYRVPGEVFSQIPGTPFAYWVGERVRDLFKELPALEGTWGTVKQGLVTTDTSRFVRCWWEVPSGSLLTGQIDTTQEQYRQRTKKGKRWIPFTKGGAHSPYYSDIALVVDWKDNGAALREIYERHRDRVGGIIKNPDFYFRPGLTYPYKSQAGFSVWQLPAGCIFSNVGQGVFARDDEHLFMLLGLLNSRPFQGLLDLVTAFGRREVGAVGAIPVPGNISPLGAYARKLLEMKRGLDVTNSLSHVFLLPAGMRFQKENLAESHQTWERQISHVSEESKAVQIMIDDEASAAYGLALQDRQALFGPKGEDEALSEGQDEGGEDSEEETTSFVVDIHDFVSEIIGYAVGCVFGRWDVRLATGQRQPPPLPDPFAPLPACSPGMLTGDDGLPVREPPAGYPLDVVLSGALVDDPEHPDDIVRRVRRVLELIYPARAEAVEREACELLGVRELRDYFRKPGGGGFWRDHLQRYSRSRRRAPIYWLLQSENRNYAVWLYYPRLHAQGLYNVLHSHVEPRVRRQEHQLEELRQRHTQASGRAVRQLERDIERGEELLAELQNFRDALKTAADHRLTPDLDDGVILNAAPLHALLPWPEARTAWEDLQAGEYDWSAISRQMREKGMVRPG